MWPGIRCEVQVQVRVLRGARGAYEDDDPRTASPRPAGAYAFAESSPVCCSGHVLLVVVRESVVRVSPCWLNAPAETPAGVVKKSSLVRPVAADRRKDSNSNGSVRGATARAAERSYVADMGIVRVWESCMYAVLRRGQQASAEQQLGEARRCLLYAVCNARARGRRSISE